MASKKRIATGLIGLSLLLAICVCAVWLFLYYAVNTVVVRNQSSVSLESFTANLPEGAAQLGPIKPGQSRRHIFGAPKRDGDLSFLVISQSRKLKGNGGQYLDGMSGEHFVITIADGDLYRVKTRFQVPQNESRLELLNK